MTQREIQHLFWRGGFGLYPGQLPTLLPLSREQLVKKLTESGAPFRPLASGSPVLSTLDDVRNMTKEARQTAFRTSTMQLMDLGIAWVNEMAYGADPFRERMALFWHDHFASSDRWDAIVYRQNNTLRAHATGSFRTLLKAMCKDALLLKYLNNHQNRKQHPNENFTRELLELFTLGEGNYTEEDIREGARAFTGHAFDASGAYQFRPGIHDYGTKSFLGRSGNFDADDIIEILLEQRQTAHFITGKIYRYFVNERPEEAVISRLSAHFYDSGYDITALMQRIFLSDEFYNAQNIGTRIKSPVDLLTGLMKHCSMQFAEPKLMAAISKLMGQTLFFPPNVAGWPMGKQWIDNSSLLFRMRLADFLLLGKEQHARVKDDPDMNVGRFREADYETRDSVTFDLRPLTALTEKEDALTALTTFLLQCPLPLDSRAKADWLQSGMPGEESLIHNLLRLPEYQLC